MGKTTTGGLESFQVYVLKLKRSCIDLPGKILGSGSRDRFSAVKPERPTCVWRRFTIVLRLSAAM